MLLKEYPQGNPEVRFLSQTVSAYVLLLNIIKFLSRRDINNFISHEQCRSVCFPRALAQIVLCCFVNLTDEK